MVEKLTVAEVRQHSRASCFSAAFCKNNDKNDDDDDDFDLFLSWVQTRGKVQNGGGDFGSDLFLMKKGSFPRILVRGDDLSGGAIFSPSGRFFCFQKRSSLWWGSTATLSPGGFPKRWLSLRAGESFTGTPVWESEEKVLLGVVGGNESPNRRHRLVLSPARDDEQQQQQQQQQEPIFVAEAGATLLGWDRSPANGDIVVVHRLANAMLAEIVLLQAGKATVLAVDGRVEYSKPLAAFLSSGALLLRLNAVLFDDENHPLRDASLLKTTPAKQTTMKHGLWILEDISMEGRLNAVHVLEDVDHGNYDVCSNSYGNTGVAEKFTMNPSRTRVLVTARKHANGGSIPRRDSDEPFFSYSDDLYLLDLASSMSIPITRSLDQKGCKIPVAISENTADLKYVYHFRSPIECGDLYLTGVPKSSSSSSSSSNVNVNVNVNNDSDEKPQAPTRLTETMPLSLKQKLIMPTEVWIENRHAPFRGEDSNEPLAVHALVYAPDASANTSNEPQLLQPLLWLHGGPMCQYSFDCNPILSWLAGLGYLVVAPNVSGSTGNGLDYMNRVLGKGCGVSDYSDCLACAQWIIQHSNHHHHLDLSRGIAVAGHSWGGYLAFLCMLPNKNDQNVFSCGIAAAGITDWFVQQRHTEVRYYDYALMGGWVYEPTIRTRARAVSPLTRAKNLRAPLLVLHGDQDTDVPFSQIPPFVEAAKCSPHLGASVEYHSFSGEGHGISSTPSVQADYLHRIQTFLRINLKPWDFTSNPHGDLTAY